MVWRRASQLSTRDVRRADELRAMLPEANPLDPCAPVDWHKIASIPKPEPRHSEEEMAQAAERALGVSWIDRLFGRVSTARQKRYKAIFTARFRDGIETQRRIHDWEFFTSLARGVLAGSTPAYIVAMNHLSSVSRKREGDTHVFYRSRDSKTLEARVDLCGATHAALRSGQAYELAARVAKDAFALLPTEVVHVDVGCFREEITLQKRWESCWTATFDRRASARITS